MLSIHFVFIGEGSSDDGLIPHIENLCIELGADEVTGSRLDMQRLPVQRDGAGKPGTKTVTAKLSVGLRLEPSANLWFFHRDADTEDPEPRYAEVASAVETCGLPHEWVAVIPVQETEAWLLLDEAAIRRVASRPSGKAPLNLPKPGHIESRAKPKELLKAALIDAAQLTGRRLRRFEADFPDHRRQLLQGLPTSGPINQLKSWIRMKDDLRAAIDRLVAAN